MDFGGENAESLAGHGSGDTLEQAGGSRRVDRHGVFARIAIGEVLGPNLDWFFGGEFMDQSQVLDQFVGFVLEQVGRWDCGDSIVPDLA